ncbi:2-oxopent-4-enoate/cis-2-oxohex-4-enoate hydratase [Pseudoxanthomonas sp. GM95]|uniref:fumarylacetoacetate hydrolase family protein n=1 Tax=Pseudoxanthomonas sp. GM95 TaxID=1881043 RepID=UPI0008D07031|nr:fumarylacetoacetate hydrolase family protein [Pseudoxanthomonas sp. GM95]SEM52539.1 2-oxopent-4-enoate/cis-2-oxohex-4-enoate hydratase [Pseudoxanthomonas sp. GM95]
MQHEHIQLHAQQLHRALRDALPIPPLTGRVQGINIEAAYAISEALLQYRLEEGEKIVGRKIGLTSAAVQKMLGVDQPDFGTLTDAMAYEDGAAISLAGMIAPRAEGEIAFILGHDLVGPGITAHDVLAATESLAACFEIVDSRIANWKIAIADTVADNASASAFVLGKSRVPVAGIDLGTCGMVVEKNGEVISTGAGAAALGSPTNCVAWLANTLGRFGIGLRAGEVILSGALVPLVDVAPGDTMRVRISGIGSAQVKFT